MDLQQLTAGLERVAAPAAERARAAQSLRAWWGDPRHAAYRPQLESLAARGQWPLLLDSFYRVIPFGTGGRRGPVGIGPNRINPHAVVTSVQGHVTDLRRRFPGARLRVVVAFDVRVFRDLRGLYDATQPNPLLGLSSRDFARLASAVYAANGVEVYTVPGDGDYFLSTPELSFAIRHLQAHGGLNISASHNHPDDNGAKVYMASGRQPVPPEDAELAAAVEAVDAVPATDALGATFDAAVAAGRIRWWDAALHVRYLETNLACALGGTDQPARRAVIAYTPLHGTGLHTVGDVLRRAGTDLRLVTEQVACDGSFPGVTFRIPNPEVVESMDVLTARAAAAGADAGFATDPDADRLGVVAPADGVWRPIGGNEIAVLLAAYIVETRQARGTLPAQAFLVKTSVTTELLTRIARANGVQIVGDLLVGFKYVGQVLDAIERDGRWGDVRAGLDDFLLGAEESNGVLVSAALRDKDACGGALLLAELCGRLRHEGRSLGDYLTDVYRRYGYAANTGYSLVMEGIDGSQQVARLMDAVRATPPPSVCGAALQGAVDRWDERAFGPLRSDTDRSARNFVQLVYDGDLHVAVRPSGTEPKIKFYVERLFDPQAGWAGGGFAAARRAMDERTREATLAFVDALLQAVGIRLPSAALVLSSLVGLEHRIDFATRFLPELQEQARRVPDVAALAAWVDARLQPLGPDPRRLVQAGVAEFLRATPVAAAEAARVRAVFEIEP